MNRIVSARAFGAELRRRKVYRTAAAYASAALVIALAVAELHDVLLLPDWTPRLVITLLLAGLPIALALSWAYDVRPEPASGEQSGGTAVAERAAPSAASRDCSIVVLPFANMSPHPADAYLADGITEEVTADLAGIRALRVISRTSAFHYRDNTKHVRAIGEELSVRYVLEGSVRRAGDQLRITYQLVDSATDAPLAARKLAGTMADIFELQERVAQAVVDTLALHLGTGEQRALAARPVPDVHAYTLYLEARASLLGMTPAGLERAQAALQQALAVTGDNATLFGQLAHVHVQFWNAGVRVDEADLVAARGYADRALALDPDSADHHFIRGFLETFGGTATEGLAWFDEAVARDPVHADALGWSGVWAASLGLEELAAKRLAALENIDPLNPLVWAFTVWLDVVCGRPVQALIRAERERASRASDFWTECMFASALLANGRRSEAAGVLRAATSGWGPLMGGLYRILTCALDGDAATIPSLLTDELCRWARMDAGMSQIMAQAFALVGDAERACHWLQHSVDRGQINWRHIAFHDACFAELRNDPRFQRIVQQSRAGWEAWHAAADTRSEPANLLTGVTSS